MTTDENQSYRSAYEGRDSVDRLELVLRATTDGFWDWPDLNSEKIWWSASFYELLGYKANAFEPTVERFWGMVHPDDLQGCLESIPRLLESEGPYCREYRIQRKGGDYISLRARGLTIRNSEGNPIRMVGSVRDITHEKLEAAKFYRQAELLEETGDIARVGGWDLDLKTHQFTLTPTAREIHEVSHHKEYTLEAVIALYPEISRPVISKAIQEAIEGGVSFDLELEFHTPQGRRRWMRAIGTPIVDQGVCVRLHGTIQDITDRKEMVDALELGRGQLESSEKFLRHTLDALTPNISILDEKGVIIHVNKAWREFAHENGAHHPNDYVGENYLQVCRSIDGVDRDGACEVLKGIQGVIEGRREAFSMEYSCHSPEKKRWFFERVNRFSIEGAVRIVISHEDVTVSKRAAEERIRMEYSLQQTQKLESLGVLAGGIAHDFNNILMSIIGNADMAVEQASSGADLNENLNEIQVAAKRAAELCQQLLAYSGRGKFLVEYLHLGNLLEEMKKLLKISISKKATLNFDVDPNLPLIHGDATQIRQVIMNLVINASESLGEDPGAIGIRLEGQCGCPLASERTILDERSVGQKCLSLTVSDTGCGMDEPTLNRIFEPFFTTKFTGRGLGMSAVLGIVRGHHGAVSVRTDPGKGTTFRILFPVTAQREMPLPTPPRRNPSKWTGSGCVLLVDDEDSVRQIGRRLLEKVGFRSLIAKNGREAVEIFRNHWNAIDLVILDLTMPEMDGEQTLAELNKIHAQVPVLLSSGYTQSEITERFSDLRMAGFIHKPYTLETLRDSIESCMSPRK